MAKVDFYADIVQTGTVFGIDAQLGPEIATEVFGTNYGENHNNTNFWRDYGFLEIFWDKRPHSRGHLGHHFTFQAHRLGTVPARFISKTIRARHGLGPFKRPLLFADLKAELDRGGVPLVPTRRDEDYQTYLQLRSGVTVMVLISNDYYQDELGHIPKIASPVGHYFPLAETETKDPSAAHAAVEEAASATYREDWQPERAPGGPPRSSSLPPVSPSCPRVVAAS